MLAQDRPKSHGMTTVFKDYDSTTTPPACHHCHCIIFCKILVRQWSNDGGPDVWNSGYENLEFWGFSDETGYKAELFEIVEQNSFDFNDLNLSKGPAACTEKR